MTALRPDLEEFFQMFLLKSKIEFDKKWEAKGPQADSNCLKDFDVKQTLGTGSFGRVCFVQHKKEKYYGAMKILNKEKIYKLKQIEHTMLEKKVLTCINHPFLVNMKCSFMDNSNIYLILEFINGGEMFTHLRNVGKFNEETTRFFASNVILAFQYLHFNKIVYRDLKPENLLIDCHGYVKITDFGFAKKVTNITWTLCGTPEYLAPEIIFSKGYNHAVDWWSLGILIFEMIVGYPPFYDDQPIQIYEKIVAGKLRFPSHVKTILKDLLQRLITSDLSKRYGRTKYEIKAHPWFEGFDWKAVHERKLKSPFIPKCEGEADTRLFEKYDEVPIPSSTTDKYKDIFANF